MRRPGGAGGSTAAVLWLMILLVFLPIAAAHLIARGASVGPREAPAAAESARHG